MAPEHACEPTILTDGGVDEDAAETFAEAIADVQESLGTIAEEIESLEEGFGEAAEAAENLDG